MKMTLVDWQLYWKNWWKLWPSLVTIKRESDYYPDTIYFCFGPLQMRFWK